VKRELLPQLETLRDQLAHTRGEKWRDAFKLTVSFAAGSPARITAIQVTHVLELLIADDLCLL